MNKKKLTTFFHHPIVVKRIPHPKQIQSTPTEFCIQPEQQQQISKSLKQLKKIQINQKAIYLQNLRLINKTLISEIEYFQVNFNTIQQKQKRHLKSLQHKLCELDTEIENCHQVEKVEALEFVQWQNQQVIKNHKQRIQELEQKYRDDFQKKNQEINQRKVEIKDAMNNIHQFQKLLQYEQNLIVPAFNQPDIVMPNLQHRYSQLGHLKEKIQSLKQNKKLLMAEIKEQLNANTWKVKDTFETSKQKIARQMRKLLNYLQRPDKQVIKNISNPQKIPNPITLIENYENRLQLLQESLQPELQTDQILKCLKPLPWRSIKGISFQSLSSKIQERYNKLQKQYEQLQTKNSEYLIQLKVREHDIIEKYNKKISEFDVRIKQRSESG